MLIISFIVNVGVALVMGVAIGVERQIHQHPAGLRTNALVCVGAALFVSLTRRDAILFGTNFAPGDWHDICAMPSCVPVRFPGWHGGSDGQTTSTSFAAE